MLLLGERSCVLQGGTIMCFLQRYGIGTRNYDKMFTIFSLVESSTEREGDQRQRGLANKLILLSSDGFFINDHIPPYT